MIEDRWGNRDGVELHYLVQQGSADAVPLVYVPGSLGRAEEFRAEMVRLAPRATLAVDKRGVFEGEAAPEDGYAFEDRVADLEAVVADARLGPACMMAFSLGVPVALGYAVRHPDEVRGLVLLDYPARYPGREDAWLERALPFAQERGIPERVVRAIHRDSERVALWSEVGALRCPVLLVVGGQSPSVSAQDLERYRRTLPDLRVETFEDAGHEVFRPDYERFMRLIEGFLEGIDAR
ncbi:MAG: alpha/beta hydrolase [Deinococcales bacterium]|jgi:pimeloyl-ACP methyl ester carboxylesterase